LQPYGISKTSIESLAYFNNALVLRCNLVVGDRKVDDRDHFVANFISSEKSLDIFNDVYRTTLFVDDLPKIIDMLIKKDVSGRIINVSNSSCLSYAEMAAIIRKEFDITSRDNIISCSNHLIPKKLALSNDLLRQIIGFTPTSFEETIKKIRKEMNR
jgi:dTDP-4-dehydrorhamnose reductase